MNVMNVTKCKGTAVMEMIWHLCILTKHPKNTHSMRTIHCISISLYHLALRNYISTCLYTIATFSMRRCRVLNIFRLWSIIIYYLSAQYHVHGNDCGDASAALNNTSLLLSTVLASGWNWTICIIYLVLTLECRGFNEISLVNLKTGIMTRDILETTISPGD